MSALDRLLAKPGLTEIDHVDIPAPGERVWEAARQSDLGCAPLLRGLPGCQLLADEPREVCMGTVSGAIQVACALRVLDLEDGKSRAEIELRAAGADADAWRQFRTCFILLGPASRYLRRAVLSSLARRFSSLRPDPIEDLAVAGLHAFAAAFNAARLSAHRPSGENFADAGPPR